MRDLRVTLVQTNQFWEDKSKNLDHFQKVLSQIVPGSSDLVLLPEMFNTSFSMNAERFAEKMDGESICWLKGQAAKLKGHIGASLIIKEGADYFNRFVVVNGEEIIAFYDKRHLFRMANEHDHFSPGKKRVVFELFGWKILLQVCYDLRFPVFARNRTRANNQTEYDLALYIANWPEKRNGIWKNLIQARAIENQAYVVGVNRVGIDGNEITYSGDSMIVDPWGNVIETLEPHSETVVTEVLRKSVLSEIKERFPAYLDADIFGPIKDTL